MSRRSVAPVLKQLAVPAASLTLSVDGHELPVTNLDTGKIFFDYDQNSRGKSLDTVPDRLESAGDPWAGMLESRQDLAEVLGLRRAG